MRSDMTPRSARHVIPSAAEREGSGPRVLALAFLLLITCARQPAATPSAPMNNPTGPRVTLPDGYTVAVEVAADDETRTQGLMYRDQLRPGTGMLFFFATTGDYPFWMKNTLIPLDIIWIDEGQKVAAVATDVPPCKADPCPSYPPNAPARYVLELAAGMAARHKVTAGSTLRFEGTGNVIVR